MARAAAAAGGAPPGEGPKEASDAIPWSPARWHTVSSKQQIRLRPRSPRVRDLLAQGTHAATHTQATEVSPLIHGGRVGLGSLSLDARMRVRGWA